MGELADRLGQAYCAVGATLGIVWLTCVSVMAVVRGVVRISRMLWGEAVLLWAEVRAER